MNEEHIAKIADELSLALHHVITTARLIEEGATVPFIARYRKEATGSLDEVTVTAIRDRMAQLKELEKRRTSILNSLEERELLTDKLKEKILAAQGVTALEDIYLPFRPKTAHKGNRSQGKGTRTSG